MKVQITYVESSEQSVQQANQALESFLKYNWDAKLNIGITSDTLNEKNFDYADMFNSRFADLKRENLKKYRTKKSCLFNNLHFCKKVIEADEPMVFAEHDAICIKEYSGFNFEEFCFLSYEYAFQPPTCLAKPPYTSYILDTTPGVLDFPTTYPLRYYKDNIYKTYTMTPGTAAYALTPKGAKKILYAAETYGLEQSDFIINSHNIRMQYIYPSPVKYNLENLNLSHKL